MAESLVCSLPPSSNPSIRSSAEKSGSEEHGDKETVSSLIILEGESISMAKLAKYHNLNTFELAFFVWVPASFSMNAKFEESKDPSLIATVRWQNVISDCNMSGGGVNQSTSSEEKLDFEVEYDGSLPFYILDAHEEIYGANARNVYLFSKEMASDLNTEMVKGLLERDVSHFSMTPVKDPPLPLDLKGITSVLCLELIADQSVLSSSGRISCLKISYRYYHNILLFYNLFGSFFRGTFLACSLSL